MPDDKATFRSVLAVAEFRTLWLAHAQSRFGDQLARVALAVLVFQETSSAALTALTYALTFLPPLLSAPLLSGLADRYSRRTVMAITDASRALVVLVMAIPGIPVPALTALLFAVVSLQPLYSAARNAMLPNVLTGDRYVVAVGITSTTDGLVQVAGFAFGGMLVGWIGPYAALLVNAATFVVSATLVRLGAAEHRPRPDSGDTPAGRKPSMFGGIGMIWGDPRLRSLLALAYLYGFYVAPEGLAAPYATELHQGTVAVGLLMAADPVGAGIGSFVLSRWLPRRYRRRALGPLAVAAGVPLVISAFVPSLPVVLGLWAISGFLSSYMMLTYAMYVQLVPDDRRGQAVGVAGAGLQTAQGLGVLLAGAVAELLSPSATVGILGAVGSVCAIAAGRAWHRAYVHSVRPQLSRHDDAP